MENIIECMGLSKKYGTVPALSLEKLNIRRGKITGLLGPNGSGKTTLIKILSGLLTPTSGQVTISGMNIGVDTKKIVSYLPEQNYFDEWMRASDIIGFFCDFYKDFNSEKALDMMKRLNVNPADRIKTMSKGTKEKVQLVLVMCREAELYLLDEPIGGVDPAARDYILNTIISNYSENSAIIISTHLISDIENILDDIIMISQGQAVMSGEADELRQREGKSIDQIFREVFKCY